MVPLILVGLVEWRGVLFWGDYFFFSLERGIFVGCGGGKEWDDVGIERIDGDEAVGLVCMVDFEGFMGMDGECDGYIVWNLEFGFWNLGFKGRGG